MALLTVRVKPRSSRSAILTCQDGIWQVAVHAPPEGGKANDEVIRLFAKAVGVSPGQIQIQSGDKSRNKILDIPSLSSSEIDARLKV